MDEIMVLRCRMKGTMPFFETPVKLTATIYYRSEASDLSDELACDCLQKAGIVKNDRLIEEKHLYRQTDKENPRVELELEEL